MKLRFRLREGTKVQQSREAASSNLEGLRFIVIWCVEFRV